jgi:hypothetical protein
MVYFEGHNESGTFPKLAFCRDFAFVAFCDPPANAQTDPVALILFAAIQALEGLKNSIQIFFVKSNAVVFH